MNPDGLGLKHPTQRNRLMTYLSIIGYDSDSKTADRTLIDAPKMHPSRKTPLSLRQEALP